MPDTSLPIIDLTNRLVLEVNRAVGELPRSQRPGRGRRGEAAAFDLLEALAAAATAPLERALAFQRRVAAPDKPRSGWLLKADVRHL